MLRERPLAEQEARDLAAAAVVRLHRARDVELVDLRLDARLRLRRHVRVGPVGPALGRDIEALGRGVDDPAVGHHRGRVDRLQALRQVDGEDGEHAEPRERGRAPDVPALDERPRLAGLRARPLDPVGRQPAGDLRAGEGGPVRLLGRGDRLRRAVVRRLEGQRGGDLGGRDDADTRPDEPGGDVGAVERERADEAEPGRLGDVHLGQNRLRRLIGSDPGGRCRQRLDPVAAAREHEQPVAVQEQLVTRAPVERERVQEARPQSGDIDGAQAPVAEREERLPVRLDEVGLVDAFLLDVRAREVDALNRRHGARRHGSGGHGRLDDRAAAEPIRADEALRLGLRVAEQLAAGAERGQPRLARFRSRASRSPRRRRSPPPAPRGARRVYRASSHSLYATFVGFVTPKV